jgi:uncharacterized protein YlxP (DUF503 family)
VSVAVLTLQLYLHGSNSLKEKRSRLKPLILRLQREFNISVAEIGYQDSWQNALVACAIVSNQADHNMRLLQAVVAWVENSWLDVEVVSEQIELL